MEKYLRHHAEPEAAALDGLADSWQWSNVVVIPACNEPPGFLRPPPDCDGRSLLILVINESTSARPEVSAGNQALAATVQARFELQWQPEQGCPGFALSLLRDPQAPRDVLTVDRFNKGRQLPTRGGVGHARKIGADVAASLIHDKRVHSSWIHCTDADVRLPETYFRCSHAGQFDGARYAALLYPFQHRGGQHGAEQQDVVLATQLYELSLRYYVAGLKSAGSPYAFHTIGSTMAVNASHYAKVRGFPKREAGEDFYLLNKLAKTGPVLELGAGPDCKPIEIEARRSDRAPFGTGATVNAIMEMADPVTDLHFYNPAVFMLLRQWLQSLPTIWQSRSRELTAGVFAEHRGADAPCCSHSSLLAGLRKIGTEQALDHAFRQSRHADQFARQMHIWFDAFRTLKLIHALRDLELPSVSYCELVADQTFCRLLAQEPDLRTLHEQLRRNLRV